MKCKRLEFFILAAIQLSFSTSVWALNSDCVRPPKASLNNLNVARDVLYARMANKYDLKMDIYSPKAEGLHPLIILIHGGAWALGKKEMLSDDAQTWAGLGYVAATIDYRLVQKKENRFPAAVQDVRCATRWLKAHALEYAIDKTRVATFGISAGAHLAAMLGTASEAQGLDDLDCPVVDESSAVSGAVSFFGPLDLRSSKDLTPKQLGILVSFLGFIPELKPSVAALASPAAHIDSKTAPFLLVHGDADALVPVRSSRQMRDALVQAGRPVEYVEVAGAAHNFGVFSDDPIYKTSMCSTLEFFDKTLRP